MHCLMEKECFWALFQTISFSSFHKYCYNNTCNMRLMACPNDPLHKKHKKNSIWVAFTRPTNRYSSFYEKKATSLWWSALGKEPLFELLYSPITASCRHINDDDEHCLEYMGYSISKRQDGKERKSTAYISNWQRIFPMIDEYKCLRRWSKVNSLSIHSSVL